MTDSEPCSSLSAADLRLALALARGLSVAEAARACSMSAPTARRRLRLQGFTAYVQCLQNETLTATLAALVSANVGAVATLVELASGAESEAVRARCADSILAWSLKLREALSVEARLTALEARAGLTS